MEHSIHASKASKQPEAVDITPDTTHSILLERHTELAASISRHKQQLRVLEELMAYEHKQIEIHEHLFNVVSRHLGIKIQEQTTQYLRGNQLKVVAVEVLSSHLDLREKPIHYKDWFELVREAGYFIGGKNPLATFLTAISQNDRVESQGKRSGMFSLISE